MLYLLLSVLVTLTPASEDRLINALWDDAQRDLVEAGYPAAMEVSSSDLWVPTKHLRGRIPCAGGTSIGCFQPHLVNGRHIGVILYQFNIKFKGPRILREVLTHEISHAILWKLGDPAWKTYGHSKED